MSEHVSLFLPTLRHNWQLQKHQLKELFYCLKYTKQIRMDLNYLFDTYKLILLYMKDDFSQYKIMLKDTEDIVSSIEIDEEIFDIDFYRNKLSGTLFPTRKRYYTFRILHHHLKQINKIFRGFTKCKIYKDIDHAEINKKLKGMDYLLIHKF